MPRCRDFSNELAIGWARSNPGTNKSSSEPSSVRRATARHSPSTLPSVGSRRQFAPRYVCLWRRLQCQHRARCRRCCGHRPLLVLIARSLLEHRLAPEVGCKRLGSEALRLAHALAATVRATKLPTTDRFRLCKHFEFDQSLKHTQGFGWLGRRRPQYVTGFNAGTAQLWRTRTRPA